MRREIVSSMSRLSMAMAGLVLGVACAQPEKPVATTRMLTEGWSLQAVAAVAGDGATVSTVGHDVSDWYSSSVPSTPMAALVANGLYPDLYFGTKLEDVDEEQFRGPWWYRTEFKVSETEAEKMARLQFAGINYSAEIWLNGQRLATREEIVGAFQVHEIDVSGKLLAGSNALAVEVFPPQPGDFTIGFVDWNPRPPDENMGIWRPVSLRLTGNVSVNDVFIETDVDLDTLETAEIRVSAILRNHSDLEVKTAVNGRIDGLSFAADVVLAPQESRLLRFTPDDYAVLRFDAPRLWWPHTLGEPNLYSITMTAKVDGRVSDSVQTTFGIREFGTYLNDEGHRGFTVNGQPVLIRGGGWVDDLLLSDTPEKIDAQLAYIP